MRDFPRLGARSHRRLPSTLNCRRELSNNTPFVRLLKAENTDKPLARGSNFDGTLTKVGYGGKIGNGVT